MPAAGPPGTDRQPIERLTLPEGKPQLVAWDEDLPGCGVVVGKKTITLIMNYRAGGVMRQQVIGRHGGLREDGHPWNATTTWPWEATPTACCGSGTRRPVPCSGRSRCTSPP